MRRHWAYLKYVLRHKWYVILACHLMGVPIWIAILHDWDKFLPDEWLPYARCFYKPDGTKQYDETIDFAHAWMLHQHRNKHHWQYWLRVNGIPLTFTNFMVWDRGDVWQIVERNSGGDTWVEWRDGNGVPIDAEPMSDVYRREMLADWIGAGRAMGKPKTWEWYAENREKIRLHPETRQWVEDQMERLKWNFHHDGVGYAA